MPMTVEIVIKGVAICYRDADFWRVVFICDSKHPVNFSDNRETEDPVPLRKSKIDRAITIFVDNPTKPKPTKGGNFSHILNMASHMHGDNVLGVKRAKPPGSTPEIISMTIPTGKLGREDFTELNYFIQEVTEGSRPVKTPLGRPVAASIKIAIELNQGRGLSMVIQDGQDITTLSYPFRLGTLRLEFDNDCHEEFKEANDFLLYYEWLVDTSNPRRKFIAGKDHGSFLDLQGNCDPVSVDPPPKPPG